VRNKNRVKYWCISKVHQDHFGLGGQFFIECFRSFFYRTDTKQDRIEFFGNEGRRDIRENRMG